MVSVGTDHHRFDRLIDWIDRSLEDWHGDEAPSCLVQHGASRAPRMADGVDRLVRGELLEHYRQADVVVVQGGPGSILDAREVGQIPLAVPRKPELNEVVDSHQAAFSDVMARNGHAVVVTTWEGFDQRLVEMLAAPHEFHTEPRVAEPDMAAKRVAAEIDQIIMNRPSTRGRFFRRLRHVMNTR